MAIRPPAEGRPGSFDSFFEANFKKIVVLIALVTKDFASAEDAAQVAFTRAAKAWERVRMHDRPDMWVVRVANNVAIDNWRKRRREVELNDRLHTPEDDYIESMSLRWGLANLSPQQRAAVVLHHMQGLPISDVAQRIGTSEPTVKTHLQRGRRHLKWLMGRDGAREAEELM